MPRGAAAATAHHSRRPVGPPQLWKFGQDVNYISHFAANPAMVASRTAQFDGFAFQTPTVNPIGSATYTLGDCQTAFSGLSAALPNWGGMKCAPMVYWFEDAGAYGDWATDSTWTRIAQNLANYVQAAYEAGCSLIMFDNEGYGAWTTRPFPYDWQSGAGILPSHTLAQAQTLVRGRGEQCMDAIRAQTPQVEMVILHPIGVGDPNFAGYIDPAPFNDVSAFHELNSAFHAGFDVSASKVGSYAKVWDGNEVYKARGVAEFNRMRRYTRYVCRTIGDYVAPRATVSPFRTLSGLTLWDYDDRNGDGPQTTAELKQNIIDGMRAAETLCILYTESHVTGDWWQTTTGTGPSPGNGIVTPAYLTAVAEAKRIGRGGDPIGTH